MSHKDCLLAAGDSFSTLMAAPGRQAALVLEDIGPTGALRRAEEARIDAVVPDVFSCHTHAGGFRFINP